jgi:hypothetical protein
VGLREDDPERPRLHVVLNWSREVAARLAARFQAQGSTFVRVWAVVALAFGLSLAYAVTGR